MSIFKRPDSPFWWLWLETAPPGQQKEKTAVLVGSTAAERRDNRRLAELVYAQRMTELASRIHRLPTARPSIRFDAYADQYARDVLPHHKGHEREAEMLRVLRHAFCELRLQAIDREQVQAWMTTRRQAVSARTVNREVDLLKAMLRDAVPKYLDASPLAGMRRLHVVTPRRRLMTPEEERKLLKKATKVEKALLLVCLDGLVRLGDALDLRREDKQGAWLYIRDSKRGEPYEVALSYRAELALDAIPGTSPFYFQRFRGAVTDRDRRSRVRRAIQALCARAGVPYGKKAGGVTFHWATRRTGASRLLVQRKVDIPTVQRQGHWKTPDVLLQIYAESDRQAQEQAIRLSTRSRGKRRTA